jgi:hypothetical protein
VSRHLAPEQFVDLLDGSRTAADVPHLAECEQCRAELAGLQATWQQARATEVPEPSPLFWDHFSARVHEAVAAEEPRQHRWSWLHPSWRLAAATSAVAALALVAALTVRQTPAPSEPPRAAAVERPPAAPAARPFTIDDDESLALVADLASELDWETAADAGLTTHEAAERVVVDMTDEEREELQRILTAAISTGA